MPNFSMQSFMAAQFAGQQLTADLDNRKTDVEYKQAQIGQMAQVQARQNQELATQQDQRAQMTKLMGQFDQEKQAQQVETGKSPDQQKEASLTQEADQYRRIGKTFAMSDPARMESFMKLADGTETRLQTTQTKNLEIGAARSKSVASYAGAVLEGSASPQDAFTWVKDNVGLKDAMEMPTDPAEYKSYWRTKQIQGSTAQEQSENARKVAEDARKAQERKDKLEEDEKDRADKRADRALAREDRRDSRASSAEDRVERRAAAASKVEFTQTEKLNKSTQAEAKPLLDDKRRVEDIEGLLGVNTSAGDQQVHQALTSFLGNFKGRATNLYYKDNKNFGSVASRMSGFLSHAFSGRYQESDRVMIRDMMAKMKSDTIEPGLASLESKSKAHAKGYGLDPDQIEVQGEFDRNAKTPANKPPSYQEGQTATNAAGAVMVFTQGKWVAK